MEPGGREVNRRERRAQAAIGRSKLKDADRALLDIACAGPLSVPAQSCDLTISVPMPFDLESLRSMLWRSLWFVTVVTPPGESPPRVTVLCPKCAEALIPDLVAVAKRHMPGSA